jgi:plasmid stabilization system protein ParE
MLYEVSLTKDAERDLEEEIYVYIAEHDSRASAALSISSLRQQRRPERLLTAVPM